MFNKLMLNAILLVVAVTGWSFEDVAFKAYREGEQATTVATRADAFNRALKQYLEWEETYQPTYGNGKLYYDIGNTFYQLEEYPRAVFYYYRALALRPRDDTVNDNLKTALSKLSIPNSEDETVLDRLFFFHTMLSLPERLQIFFVMGVVLLAVGSAYVWLRWQGLRRIMYILGVLWSIFLVSVLYTRYFALIEGVIVQPAALYRDAGEQYAKVSKQPVLPGSKVRVLNVVEEGTWLKVLTPTGEVGYVPNSVIRLI